jgi:superfamily II DNA or RNA helicase
MNSTITIRNGVLAGKVAPKSIVLAEKMGQSPIILRRYQCGMIGHMKQNRLTLVESPTGSGKTNVMLAYAAFVRRHKKVIVITPQLGINHNFTKYTKDGDWCAVEKDKNKIINTYTLSYESVKESQIQKSASMKRFLNGPGGTVRVSSYKAFDLALDDETIDMSDVVLLVDEVHHSDMKDENLLGSILRKCIDRCSEVHAFTATDFRSDGGQPTSEEFSRFRRLLKEHYHDGCCPDFGVFLRFYRAVNQSDFDRLAETEDISNKPSLMGAMDYPELLKAYIDEYKKHPLPTIMYVDGAKQALDLQKLLLSKCKGVRILNFGSDDGKTLISNHKHLRKAKLDAIIDSPRDYDVVIAIKLFDEGMDWVECAQTFNPRLTSSLQRFIQRCVGRALRHKKNPKHLSPNLSRVVIFEVSLDDEDQDVVKNANLQIAIRIKAICSGLDFTDTFMLTLPQRRRVAINKERDEFRLQINSLQNNEILQRILQESAAGASANELIEMLCKQCAKHGVAITPILAISLLMQYDVIDKNDRVALEEIIRKRDQRLSKLSFKEFMNDPEVKEAISKLKVIGITDYFGIINGLDDFDEIERILIRFNANSARENKRKLIELAKSGGKRPNRDAVDHEEKRLAGRLGEYTNKKKNYDVIFDTEIRRLRSDWFEDSVQKNKDDLIALARVPNSKRPTMHTKDENNRRLGRSLSSYTSKRSSCYDSAFDRSIRTLRPDWFEKTAQKKSELLALAKHGQRRPRGNSKNLRERQLSAALNCYLNKNRGTYDHAFDIEIHQLRPDWFNVVAEKKEVLLSLAASGAPRPTRTTDSKLSSALQGYTCKANVCNYDSVFDGKIRQLRPDWFERTSVEKKKHLVMLAEKGATRPRTTSDDADEIQLGRVLYSYTNKSTSYDYKFDRQIRALRPDWFEDTAAATKIKLLGLARRKEERRPKGSSINREERLLAGKLSAYINKNSGSYDPEFDKQIRSLRPDWFENTARIRKAELLRLANRWEPKPSNKFGRAIFRYTNKNSCCYDPEFDKQIRSLRPDWFEDTAMVMKSILLRLAGKDECKPKQHCDDADEARYASRLSDYTNKNSRCYDPEFDKQIRSLRPDWFIHGSYKKAKRGKYAGRNEYREFLVKALRYYGLTSFSDCEFWTLGGKEWYEHKHLVDAGVELGPNTYHNVDKDAIDKAPKGACAHSDREFLTIHKLWNRWKNPRVISYDATMGMVESRTEYWQELCYLAIAAAKKSGYVLFSWNFMEGYTHTSWQPIEKGVYKKWLQSLKGFAESEGLRIDFFQEGQITKRPTSQTPMLAGCCKLSLVQATQKTA